MSRITGYAGPVEPRGWFSFKSVVVPGAHATADPEYQYVVANPSLYEMTVTFHTGTRAIVMHRRASRRAPQFDTSFGIDTFAFDALPAADLNEIFDAHDLNRLTVLVTIRLRYLEFFKHLLEYMTRRTADTHNIARPADQAAIEASFHHRRHGTTATVTHLEHAHELVDIPCMLSSWDILPRPGHAPTVKLYLYLLVRERLTPAQRDDATLFLATADYSRIYLSGAATARREPAAFRLRERLEQNVKSYIWNHTDLRRGERIRQEIIGLGAGAIGRPQLQAVDAVRTAIDERLVTANHWGDRREDWGTERYQRKLSDLFGAIHQHRWTASPVSFLRWITNGPPSFTVDEQASLALQHGAGHCGEHSQVSYSVLSALIAGNASGPARFVNVVLSGFANIDHAFVVGGFTVHASLEVVATVVPQADPIWIFDLPAALAANGNVPGFVLDPYLAPGRFSTTCQALVQRIAAPHGRGGRTRYITIWGQSPAPTPVPVSAATPAHI